MPSAGAGSSSGSSGSSAKVLVSRRQEGNPLLSHLRHVLWEFSADIKPDFVPNRSTAVLFLSLRYHALKPRYLARRMGDVRSDAYRLRVVLAHADMSDVEHHLLEVTRLATAAEWTVVVASSVAEAARYVETYKAYEHKPATVIQERVEDTYLPRVAEVLTAIRAVNRADVLTLLSRFGSLAGIMTASLAELQTCAGIAEKKAQRIWDAFHRPIMGGGSAAGAGSGGSGGGGGGAARAGAAATTSSSAPASKPAASTAAGSAVGGRAGAASAAPEADIMVLEDDDEP